MALALRVVQLRRTKFSALRRGLIFLFLVSFLIGCSAIGSVDTNTKINAFTGLTLKDKALAQSSFQTALEKSVSGKSTSWKNSATGARGSITPIKTWKTSSGFYCRTYKERIRLASGKSQNSGGTACRSKSGGWKAA
ncbi:MAG: RT0821/Lpp0805 family surface protein [Roseibium sp.]